MSPDPSGWSAVNLMSPQSLNRYAYVKNNPLRLTDPMGLVDSSMCTGSYEAVCNVTTDPNEDFTVIQQTISDLIDSNPSQSPIGDVPVATMEYAPNNAPTPPGCQAKILNATNNQFGTNYTNADVTKTFSYSTGAPPDTGTFNVNISASTAGVSPGYYPVNWYTYIIGYGPTLHVVSGPGGHGGLDSQQTLPFSPTQGTFHIDSGFPYNPFGALSHWLLNMTKVGGYPGC